LDPPYDIKLVLCRRLHLFLGKSTKTAACRAALFVSNMGPTCNERGERRTGEGERRGRERRVGEGVRYLPYEE